MSASNEKDLTRWNRAGLSRFEYIDGNAATFLEILREQLSSRFIKPGDAEPYWQVLQNPPSEVEEDATGFEREEQLRMRSEQILSQYQAERGDWAWEISRSFARASHILAGYIDAYANEGYVGTATQWDNVRRMVEMLDYHPAPPASATTRLAIFPKEKMSGVVAKGFQVKNSPILGAEKVIFETLEDLIIDPKLSKLQVDGWNKSEQDAELAVWRAKGKPRPFPGDVAIVFNKESNEANAALVDRIDEADGISFQSLDDQHTWEEWPAGELKIQTSPRWNRECWLDAQEGVVHTVEPHGLSKGAYIGWLPHNAGVHWEYAKVIEADNKSLKLKNDSDTTPNKGDELFLLTSNKDIKFSSDVEVLLYVHEDGTPATNIPQIKVREPTMSEPPVGLPSLDSIFTINSIKETSEEPGGGGGLLPPASLPKIGSFLFPSPMLPMDLVKAAVELMLSLGVMQIPSSGEYVIKGIPLGALLDDMESLVPPTDTDDSIGNKLFYMLDSLYTETEDPLDPSKKLVQWQPAYVNADGTLNKTQIVLDLNTRLEDPEIKTTLYQEVTDENVIDRTYPDNPKLFGKILTIPEDLVQAEKFKKAVVAESVDAYRFDGIPDRIKEGDWVVGHFNDDSYKALKIENINPDSNNPDIFSVSFKYLPDSGMDYFPLNRGLKEIHADFRGESIFAEGADVNNNEIDSSGEIRLEVDISENLKVGQYIILTAKNKKAILTKIDSISTDGKTITTNPTADSFGFTKGELIIYGNVVLCGHGERMPEKILGSGDAAQKNQSFVFNNVERVSFIADDTKNSGVAADIDVVVDGQKWEQVSSLKDSGTTDIHYSVYMTQEGFLKINFGDGEHGRRLPSGSNNVRIRYRKGTGLAGKLDAGSLDKPVKPHPLVDSVLQPLPSTGGNEMEDIASLRANAPASVMTMDRAVSLTDFENLSTSDSRVWQAKALSRESLLSRYENIEIIIVPAGGGELGELQSEISKSLQSKALPGVMVHISNYKEVPLNLDITIHVKKDEYDPEQISKDVEEKLRDAFSIERSKLGGHLYLSQVYKVVENVKGVERSICKIDNKSDLRVKKAGTNHLIYLTEKSTLTVTPKEYLS